MSAGLRAISPQIDIHFPFALAVPKTELSM
jgi:hypothetical protein